MQTPSKASPGANISLSEIPLPPATSAEEDELATPKGGIAGSGGHSGSQPLNVSTRSNQDILDELFGNTQTITKAPAGLGNSIETASSTASFPVGNLRVCEVAL